MKQIHPSKKDLLYLGVGNPAGVMAGEDILNDMRKREQKDQEGAAKEGVKTCTRAGGEGRGKGRRKGRSRRHSSSGRATRT